MIRSISVRDFRNNISDALNRVAYRGEHIGISRRDEIVAVLVSYEDLKELRKLREAHGIDPDFEAVMNRVLDKNEKLYKRLAVE